MENYPKLDKVIVMTGDSNSFYKRGTNLEKNYNSYIEMIDKCEYLSDNQKMEIAIKFHKLYSDYAERSVRVLSPMVTGSAAFPVKQNEKRISSEMGAWEAIEQFMEKYPQIFKADENWYGRSLYEQNKEREAIFECDDYKIVEYKLVTGAKRIGFHFTLRIKRQLQVALKSRGFRWNSNVNLWGGKVEAYEKHKEWCHSLSQNYPDYIK